MTDNRPVDLQQLTVRLMMLLSEPTDYAGLRRVVLTSLALLAESIDCQIIVIRTGVENEHGEYLLRLYAAWGIDALDEAEIRDLPTDVGSPVAELVGANTSSRSFLTSDIQQQPLHFKSFAVRRGLHVLYAVGLKAMSRGHVGVTMSFSRTSTRAFSREEQNLCESIADFIAHKIAQVRTSSELRRQLDRGKANLAILGALGTQVRIARGSAELAHQMVEVIRAVLKVDVCDIFVEKGGYLRRFARAGEWVEEGPYRPGEGQTGSTLKTGLSILSGGDSDFDRFEMAGKERHGLQTVVRQGNFLHHILAVPFRGVSSFDGVLRTITKREANPALDEANFGEDDVRLLEIIGAQLAIAMGGLARAGQAEIAAATSDALVRMLESLNRESEVVEILRVAIASADLAVADFVDVAIVEGFSSDGRPVLSAPVNGLEKIGAPPMLQRIGTAGVIAQTVRERRPFVCEDTLLAPDSEPWLIAAGIRLCRAIPLLEDSEILGVVALYRKNTTSVSESDDAVQQYVRALSSNLYRVRAMERQRSAARVAEARMSFSERLSAAAEVKDVVQATTDCLRYALDADRVAFVLIDDDQSSCTVVAHTERDELLGSAQKFLVCIKRGSTATETVFRQPWQAYDAANDPRLALDAIHLSGTKSILTVPVIVQGSVIATLCVESVRQKVWFGVDLIDAARQFGMQSGLAYQNLRLLNEAENKIARITEHFSLTIDPILPHLELDEMYKLIVSAGARILDAEDCSLFWVIPELNWLDLVASKCLPPDLWHQHPAKISDQPGAGLVAFVAATRETLRLTGDEARSHLAFSDVVLTHLPYLPSGSTTSLLCVPVLGPEGEAVGVIRFENKKRRSDGFSESDVSAASVLANRAAIYIQRVTDRNRIAGESQRRATDAERKRLGHELHNTINELHFGAMTELDLAVRALGVGAIRSDLQKAYAVTRQVYSNLRSLMYDTEQPVLHEAGLTAALGRYIRNINECVKRQGPHSTGVDIVHAQLEELPHLPFSVAENLYQIARGALSNAIKYSFVVESSEDQVAVGLSVSESVLTLSIRDPGPGFRLDARADSSGLVRMRDLAKEIGATLSLRSQVDQPTEVFVQYVYDWGVQ